MVALRRRRSGYVISMVTALQAPSSEFFAHPLHPYTQEQMAAIPSMPPVENDVPMAVPNTATILGGEARGYPLAPRCPRVEARCRQEAPILRMVAPDNSVSCHLV
jgi:oligopeptide/dipeptide ABC transporter ATP-binding protein